MLHLSGICHTRQNHLVPAWIRWIGHWFCHTSQVHKAFELFIPSIYSADCSGQLHQFAKWQLFRLPQTFAEERIWVVSRSTAELIDPLERSDWRRWMRQMILSWPGCFGSLTSAYLRKRLVWDRKSEVGFGSIDYDVSSVYGVIAEDCVLAWTGKITVFDRLDIEIFMLRWKEVIQWFVVQTRGHGNQARGSTTEDWLHWN
jgi:hypothetical protein